MCLSTIYLLKNNEPEELCTNIMSVTTVEDRIRCVNILGVVTEVSGKIEKINLMDNYIYIRPINQ